MIEPDARNSFDELRVALIHYWLVGMRGGERVLEVFCDLFPQADIYTHVLDRTAISERLSRHKIFTTFIDKMPGARRYYQKYLGLMPLALEQLDLSAYDLVISSESGPAKGVLARPDAMHICYCHSPMRYIWDMYHEYRESLGVLMRWVMPGVAHRMRIWDVISSFRVDHFIANSRFVAQRIRRVYRRDAEIVHPPVDVERFRVEGADEDFYLFLGQMTGYKRPDIALEAFRRLGKRLVVIGGGELTESLRQGAGRMVEVMGKQPDHVVTDYLQRCRALIFPGQEDFGMVPVEAMACGKPVIAFGRGGILDSVVPGVTGVLFDDQSPEGLVRAVGEFEASGSFDRHMIRAHAERFSTEVFRRKISALIWEWMAERRHEAVAPSVGTAVKEGEGFGGGGEMVRGPRKRVSA